jgi:gas vesicle protein
MGEGANFMNRDAQDRTDAFDDATVLRTGGTDGDLEHDVETAEIRANIEQTRADMSETINAIQERLNPTHLKEQAKEQVREQFEEAKEMVREATIGRVEHMVQHASDTVNDARYTMMDTIRENPIPAALVGLGLGWLFMNRSTRTPVRYSGRGSVRGVQTYTNDRQGYYDDRRGYYDNQRGYVGTQGAYYDNRQGYNNPGMMDQGRQAVGNTIDRAQSTVSNVAGSVSDTASNIAGTVSDTASNIAGSVSDTASYLTDQAQYQAQRVEDRFQDSLQTNPLAVGAIAIALGTAVGLALPQTQRENEWMGEARDTLIDRAQEVAQNTMEKVQRVASEVTNDTTQSIKEQSREHGLT